MDSKDIRMLMEAYKKVHQQLDEAVKGQDSGMRQAASAERRGGDKRLSPSKGKGYADQQKQSIAFMDKVTKKNKNVVGLVTKEEIENVDEATAMAKHGYDMGDETFDIFDVVLEFLQAEGYAETLEEAKYIMVNELSVEDVNGIFEALAKED